MDHNANRNVSGTTDLTLKVHSNASVLRSEIPHIVMQSPAEVAIPVSSSTRFASRESSRRVSSLAASLSSPPSSPRRGIRGKKSSGRHAKTRLMTTGPTAAGKKVDHQLWRSPTAKINIPKETRLTRVTRPLFARSIIARGSKLFGKDTSFVSEKIRTQPVEKEPKKAIGNDQQKIDAPNVFVISKKVVDHRHDQDQHQEANEECP